MNTTGIVLITVGLYFLFVWKGGKVFPLMYLFLFIYFIQYIFSVYLSYNEYNVLRQQMVTSEKQLFEYLVPAMCFLFAGVFLFNKDIAVNHLWDKIDPNEATRLGHFLVAFSFFCDIFSFIGLPGFSAIVSFTYFIRFSGAMCYLFAPNLLNLSLMGVLYSLLLISAVQGGVFVDFFVWAAYLFLIFAMKFNWSFKARSSFILLAVPVLVVIQLVKSEYRAATWTGKKESGLGLITELAEKNQEKENQFSYQSSGVMKTVGRLNQGWHLGLVLRHVPRHQPFLEGQDMITDLQGIVLPRVLLPDKKIIGSQEKFRKFTGQKLRGRTSMTIGVFGDFYVNFGWWGSLVAAFFFGAFIALSFRWFMIKYVLPDPLNIVWVPFLFTYLVRANNDFYIVMNHLFKGYLIFLFANYLRHQFWPQTKIASPPR